MEKQNKNFDNEEFKDTDQGFNARNQYSGSGDFSPDTEEESIESSLNSNDEPESPTDLQQDESGTLKSNN
ncbi:hypothetical protein [Flavobacterium sp. 1355]|uniref:hypothetical protein n=1 Tax=Flavobacterium sp. 1355 TaxID=2806571 RepID=UPI001AE593E3|nr:hypothetical protein [Flavobacterium sp. 1355]MBP1225669.1 hypothetical protein [Flavobacterium sp. 1355]